jgi:hypothetical protein
MKRVTIVRRPLTIPGLVVAGLLASASGVYAQPNQLKFTFVVNANDVSDCFQLPVFDEPVMVEGAQITLGWRGTGFVHATYSTAEGDPVLTWTGVHAEKGAGPSDAVIAGGYTFDGVPPSRVVDVGYSGVSYLETCPSDASSLRIHNLLNQVVTVVIKETW